MAGQIFLSCLSLDCNPTFTNALSIIFLCHFKSINRRSLIPQPHSIIPGCEMGVDSVGRMNGSKADDDFNERRAFSRIWDHDIIARDVSCSSWWHATLNYFWCNTKPPKKRKKKREGYRYCHIHCLPDNSHICLHTEMWDRAPLASSENVIHL